jgi:phosphatidylinositol-3-phosphatase
LLRKAPSTYLHRPVAETNTVNILVATLATLLAASAPALPHAPAHVVVIVEENKDYSQIVGNTQDAPYLNELAKRGALFTHSYAITHPSQPNYLALFAGVTNDNGDGCPPQPLDMNGANLAQELAQAHRTFAGYSEDLPAPGSRACWSGNYARKHVPWVDFSNVPDSRNLPYSSLPAYTQLPTVSFIIPNQLDDMHSASIARGDEWLKSNVGPLIDWGMKHDTLVIVTWDENNGLIGNRIPTIFVGPMVRPGRYDDSITHYRVLRTIEDLYGLSHAGASAGVTPITGIWR